jgi:hypothetical protein
MVNKPNIPFEAQRAKFALGKSVRAGLFREITECNARLKELLDTSDEINLLRLNRTAISRGVGFASLSRVWTHASNIFNLLANAWKCDCSSFHRINLMLEPRISASEVRFNLLFLFSRNLKLPPCPTWKSLRTRVDIMDQVKIDPPDAPPVAQRSFSELSLAVPNRSPMRSSFAKRGLSSTSTFTL